MNLVCPHCAKVIDIPQELAGKTTTCPSCSGPFTVPLVPPEVLTVMKAPKESKADTPPAKPEEPAASPKPVELSVLPAPAAEPPPTPPALTNVYRLALTVSEGVLPFLAPACLVLMLALMFLPWTGAYVGQTALAEQSGFGAAFSMTTWLEGVTPLPGVGMSVYLFLHFLCLIFGLLTVLGVLFSKYSRPQWRQRVERIGQRLIAWRLQLLCIFTLLALLCLTMLVFVQLPFEREATGEGVQQLLKDGLKLKYDVVPAKMDTDAVKTQWVHRCVWFYVALVLNLLAFLGALADWYCTRYPNRALPHLEIVWGERA